MLQRGDAKRLRKPDWTYQGPDCAQYECFFARCNREDRRENKIHAHTTGVSELYLGTRNKRPPGLLLVGITKHVHLLPVRR